MTRSPLVLPEPQLQGVLNALAECTYQLEELDSRIEELERQPDFVQTIQLMFLRLELPTVARKYNAAHARALQQGVRPGVEYHATTSAGVAYSVRITAAGGEAWRLE